MQAGTSSGFFNYVQTTNGLNGSISAGKHAFSRYVLPKA